jgi:hypothetical protein
MTDRQAYTYLRLLALDARITAGDDLVAVVDVVRGRLLAAPANLDAFIEAAVLIAERPG